MFDGKGTISYLYDAMGTKLAQTSSSGKTNLYLGNLMVENGKTIIFTGEGRLYETTLGVEDTAWLYEYWLKDHLGNTRISFTADSSDVMPNQYTDYYPFGLEHGHPDWYLTNDNRYLYNGKELQTDFDLNWYDYGARFYDPTLGRWNVIDQLTENMPGINPYSYCFNNPFRYIDPFGLQGEVKDNEQGQTDIFGRNRFDASTGMYIPPMDRPGGIMCSGFGDPRMGHFEMKFDFVTSTQPN